ncbi:MAG: biopolymer transporter ExbD [Ignavibacteria bacterium]|nr:biopolymer transporter ExbD [Bacteroidota bacterium]MSQ45569.1 biopolymer transporter ExbD [Ignavibacteria bacterium]
MKFEVRNRIRPEFNYSSLSDIVMQLLIFFLLASSFVALPGVNVALPEAIQGEVTTDQHAVIVIQKTGELFLNRVPVTKETLAQLLIPMLDKDRQQVVIIYSDKEVSLQQAVEVIDIAKGIGAKKFMIATEPPQVVSEQ